ncbi:MAG: ATP-binding cassette domain-containing protein [Clostridia bacterium]|nr:ATP-binding cassette domain-containing protein [Clostridia bacterium]
MEILQVKNLSFRYPEAQTKALKNINFSVSEGDFCLLCGESGCGKSTLLELLKRELQPFGERQGEVLYQGISTDKLPADKSASDIGFVLQNPDAQIVTDKVWHELAFSLENLGYEQSIIHRRVAEMASYFGIESWFRQSTATLSGGQKQLLNLVSIMALNPRVLLLDEPTAQLDPIAASDFLSTLRKLNRDFGITVILAEHRLEEVLPNSDKVLIMDKGQLIYNNYPKNIADFFSRNPDHPMLFAMPSSMRIFTALNSLGECPLTVRDGRKFITENFANNTDALPATSYTPSKDKAVELKDICFRYEKNSPDVLRALSLCAYKGEHLCILGGNGTGKTTLLNIVAGLRKPYHGKVLIQNKNIKDYKSGSLYKDTLAMMPQNPEILFTENSLEEDLQACCKTMNLTKEDSSAKIKEIAEKLGIDKLLHMHPCDLSGGELQKAALAKLLLRSPQVLLLDEPTKGIDSHGKKNLIRILKTLTEKGITVITVTHDVEFAAESATRCALVFDAEVVSVDTPKNFFSQNSFYTTATSRMTRGFYKNAVLPEDAVALCRLNSKGGEQK